MEVHSRVDGSAFQNGISEWKCILEWNLRVELNGPYGLPYHIPYTAGNFRWVKYLFNWKVMIFVSI